MKPNKQNPFESAFRAFVLASGGKPLTESPDGCTADFLFNDYNVIAELKTLTVDSTGAIGQKLKSTILAWKRKNRRLPPGFVEGDQFIVEIKHMPPEIRDVFLDLLKKLVEPIVRAANKQIRETKERLNLHSHAGILVVANEANPYHDDPKSFNRLIGLVLRKRTQEGAVRFPHINGVVFFSDKIKTRKEGMFFWANLQVERGADGDVQAVEKFQRDLEQNWYRYFEQMTGTKVRQHPQN